MKRIYSILTLVVAALCCSLAASASVTHTFVIDDASNINIIRYGSTTDTLAITTGTNTFEFDYDSYGYSSVRYYIVAKDGCFVTAISYVNEDSSVSGTGYVSSYQKCSLYLYKTYGNTTVTVTTAGESARSNKVIVNVDSAALVTFKRYATSTTVSLNNGENTVYFADFEPRVQISHVNYISSTLYKVVHNGTEVSKSTYYYYIDVVDGDTIDITAVIPDIDIKFKVSITEGCEDFITSVTVNGDTVTSDNYLSDSYTIKAGSAVILRGNSTDYKVNSLTENGTTKSFTNYYSSTLTSDTELVIDVTKYGTDTIYVTIDDPDAITFRVGSNTVALSAGTNVVEKSQSVSYVYYYVNDGYYVDTVLVDGSVYTSTYIYPSNGTTIEFKTGIIVRDKTYAFYIDDFTDVSYVSVDGTYLYAAGYTTYDFYDGDLPIYVYSNSTSAPYVYLNDSIQTASQSYGSSYVFAYYYFYTVNDGDVIKYFFAGEPSTYTATFTVTGDASSVTATKDLIVNVSDWQSGISGLKGTQVTLTGEGISSVTVDGTEISASDYSYTFSLTSNVAVAVTMSNSVGITEINADAVKADNNVYNAAGVLIIPNATDEQIRNLSSGFYIVNGKKMIIR